MPYIIREDGEHFVIPSYRDILTVKNSAQLKRDIGILSQSYGEYITLQKKSSTRYEVAFSPETGYLLGESIWHHFKRPQDLIYCEALPNTSEALLVIVKSGSVYLDGSFPVDSIPEELVIFLTQQNNFEIYVYGDVSISQTPEEGKFSFEASSVKSFTLLDKPVFPTLPLVKAYQLRLVNQVLQSQGIGVFPTKKLVTFLFLVGAIWFGYQYLSSQTTAIPVVTAPKVNPYQAFLNALRSPAPYEEINAILNIIRTLNLLPGWNAIQFDYSSGSLQTIVTSSGGNLKGLFDWADRNHFKAQLTPRSVVLLSTISVPKRPAPKQIYSIQAVFARLVDNLARVYPGNHIQIGEITSKGNYVDSTFTININDPLSPLVLALIVNQLKDLPFILKKMNLTILNGSLQGSITFEALGSQP